MTDHDPELDLEGIKGDLFTGIWKIAVPTARNHVKHHLFVPVDPERHVSDQDDDPNPDMNVIIVGIRVTIDTIHPVNSIDYRIMPTTEGGRIIGATGLNFCVTPTPYQGKSFADARLNAGLTGKAFGSKSPSRGSGKIYIAIGPCVRPSKQLRRTHVGVKASAEKQPTVDQRSKVGERRHIEKIQILLDQENAQVTRDSPFHIQCAKGLFRPFDCGCRPTRVAWRTAR